MGSFDGRLLRLAGEQHFVVSRPQLLELGSERQIKYRLKRGALERIERSVYRIPGSPESWKQSLMAACLASGKFSAASFRSAAQLYDLPGGDEIFEITSARHFRTRGPKLRPHESNYLTDLDITYVDNIPVTRVARVLVDLGLLVERNELTPVVLDRAMHEAVRRDIVDVTRVGREWERLGGRFRQGGEAVEAMLANFVPPLRAVDSRPEVMLLQLFRAANLPEPVPQFRVWLSATRWVDLDFTWPDRKRYAEFDPYKWHGGRDKYQRDLERRLQLRKLGWDGISIGDDELDSGAELAIGVLKEMLEQAS
jgi:hypothetical protein